MSSNNQPVKETDSIVQLIRDISERLDSLEVLQSFSVRAHQRFMIGDRVEFSAAADRKGISKGRKDGVRMGKVVSLDGFHVGVLLDGYKTTREYHHIFFNKTYKRAGVKRRSR